MSYSLINGDQVATANWNGRSRAVTGTKSRERTPWESVVWAMLELAIDQTKILCRYGLINRHGDLREWPRKREFREGHWRNMPRVIATMNDPLEHYRLREFWNEPTQAQHWCDLVGFGVPAKDVWSGILKHHAK